MPFSTRPHFEDRQIVQYGEDVINLSGQTRIAPTILDFSGATTGETTVTINGLTGYLNVDEFGNPQRLSGLVVEPAQLRISGSTGTTTQNVTGFVLQSIDPYGSVEWGPISGVSWSVSACTSPLYVSTIEACPNPTDPIYITAGNVQFGASPSLIADITNTKLGIGTGSPSERLHVEGGDLLVQNTSGSFSTDIQNSVGPLVLLSGSSTDLPRFGVKVPTYDSVTFGVRGGSEPIGAGYGKQGDAFIYSSIDNNGFNIISQPGTGTDDYVRFFVGQAAGASGTADLYIQGSGSTRGNIGINNESPTEKLHIISAVEANIKVEADTGNVDETDNANILLTQDGGISTARFGMSPDGDNHLLIGVNSTSVPSIKFATRSDGTSFSTTADTKVTISNAGNVGIGTETPTEKLHVEGSVRIVDGTEQTGYVLTSDAQGNATWQFNSTGFSGNTSGTCITDLYITNLYGCSPVTVHDSLQHVTSSGTGVNSIAWGEGALASGDYSHAQGGSGTDFLGTFHRVTASGLVSHAQGYSLSSGIASHAEGGYDGKAIRPTSATTASAHAEGAGTLASADMSHAEGLDTIASGIASHTEGTHTLASGNRSHAEGSFTTASGIDSHAGGNNSTVSGSESFIHSTNSLLTGDRGVLLGGQNITGSTDDTVYVPNLTVRNDHILHSDSVLEVSDLPGSLGSEMKGSFTEFNWNGVTANVNSNNNPSGFTSVIIGNTSSYPTLKPYGFISYFNSGYTRTDTPVVGNDFNRNKLFIKTAQDSDGMVINPKANDPSGTLWFEMDSRSVMKLKGDGVGKANLGIAMNPDGTEDATANLQIGGTGTTGTFKYRDGNQQSGYVLTSDSDGNASWGPAGAFTGNTSATCISDLYVSNIHSCSPLHINPLDEGNLYFGSTSAITFNVSNGDIELNSANNRIIGGNDGTGPFLSLSDTSNYVYTATAGGQKPNLYMEEGYGVDLYYYNPSGGNYKTYLALNDNIDLRLNNSTGTTPTINVKNITALPSDRGLIYIGLNGEGGTNVNGLTLGTNYTNDVTSDTYTGLAAILGARNSTVSRSVENSVIVGGNVNKIETGVTRSVIVAGSSNNIDGDDSVIAGGSTNTNDGDNSAIIGGSNNSILTGVQRSVILGGQNIVVSKDDQVHATALFTQETSTMAGITVNGGPLIVADDLFLTGVLTTTGSGTPVVSGRTTWAMNLTGANTAGLPDAGGPGQRLAVYVRSGGGGGNSMVITPTTLNGYSTITLTNNGDSVDLLYDGTSGWTVMGGNGYSLA